MLPVRRCAGRSTARGVVLALVVGLAAPAIAQAAPTPAPYLFWDDGDVLRLRFGHPSRDAPRVKLFRSGQWVHDVQSRMRRGDGPRLWEARLGQVCDAAADGGVDAYQLPGQAVTSFRRPPCAAEDTVRVSFLADTQMDTSAVREVLQQADAFRPQAYVIGGDLVQRGGNEAQWRAYFAAIAPRMSARMVLTVPGNHEYFASDDANPYHRYYAPNSRAAAERRALWRDVTLGPLRVFLLDSTVMLHDERASAQRAWFARRLEALDAAGDRRWRVVVFHHPPYSSSVAHIPVYFSRHQHAVRADYVPLFESHDVALVLAGHVHLYERSTKNGVTYVNAGPAGGLFGFVYVENPALTEARGQVRTLSNIVADDCAVVVQTRDRLGVLADRFRLSRSCGERRGVGRTIRAESLLRR